MDYSQFKFKNKPTIDEILSYNNLFISGTCGSGKSVLLHQIVADIMAKKDYDKYALYIHDPKTCEFYNRKKYKLIKNFILESNEQEFIQFLSNEIARRKLLSMKELDNGKTIVFISDDFGFSNLVEFLMSIYRETKQLKILLILAAQQKNTYTRNKSVLDYGTVFFLDYPYEDDYRTIDVRK